MKTIIFSAFLYVISTFCVYGITEDFDGSSGSSYTIGARLLDSAWFANSGDTTASTLLVIGTPSLPTYNTSQRDIHISPSLNVVQRNWRVYPNPGFTDMQEVTYSAWMLRYASNSNVAVGLLASTRSNGIGPVFGILNGKFYIRQSSYGSTYYSSDPQYFPINNHWYEVKLVVEQNADPAQSTGTLFTRDITNGDTTFSAQPGLTDVVLNFYRDLRTPSLFDAWWVMGYGGGELDNLSWSASPLGQTRDEAQLLQDFETSSGPTLASDGWSGSANMFSLGVPFSPVVNTSTQAISYGGIWSWAYAEHAFSSPSGFQNDESVWFSGWLYSCPISSGGGNYIYGSALVGANNGSAIGGNTGILFGLGANTRQFFVRAPGMGLTTTETGTSGIADHWFESRLVIKGNVTPSLSTATLYVRDLTLGQTTFQSVPGLQNVAMPFNSATNAPARLNTWDIGGWGAGQIDNLAFGRTFHAQLCAEALPPVEDSETAIIGQSTSTLGWSGSTASFTFAAPTTDGGISRATATNTTNVAIAVNPGSTCASITKPFASGTSPFPSTDPAGSNTKIWYSGWMNAGPLLGGAAGDLAIGLDTGSTAGVEFGIQGNTRQFFIKPVGAISRSLSSVVAAANDWYDVRLVITQAASPAATTGTLYIRDLSQGQVNYSAINLSGTSPYLLGFTASIQPTTINTWRVTGSQGGQIDNLAYGRAVSLTGDTSHPDSSTFAFGDPTPITLTFKATGLHPNDNTQCLNLRIVDETGNLIQQPAPIPVTGVTAQGSWTSTPIIAPNSKQGFYRVYASLSSGAATVAALGTRPEGYLTYCVVPDPINRPAPNENTSRFGMQGGFNSTVTVLPYLGVRWVLAAYSWNRHEPNGPVSPFVPPADPSFTYLGNSWQVFTIPNLLETPDWAVVAGTRGNTGGGTLGVLTTTPNQGQTVCGEVGCTNYCTAAATAYLAANPTRSKRYYQITWEPCYPWGFYGTQTQLARVYQLAYAAIHAADPGAIVMGPTGYNLEAGGVGGWNTALFQGSPSIAPYIDAFCIHPYVVEYTPDPVAIANCRSLAAMLSAAKGGTIIPMLGTEQGINIGTDPEIELYGASVLIREHLIMLGEGYQLNFGFYITDFGTGKGGYGYYYNLQQGGPFGANKTGPKPVAPAFAALTYLVDGYSSATVASGLTGTQAGYVFNGSNYGNNASTTAVWDYGASTSTYTMTLTNANAKVCDWMGNDLSTSLYSRVGTTLTLYNVGNQPIYVVQ